MYVETNSLKEYKLMISLQEANNLRPVAVTVRLCKINLFQNVFVGRTQSITK
jgi:hypothetical protein